MNVMIKKGFMSMPMLEVDGKYINFHEAIKWVISQWKMKYMLYCKIV